MSLYRDLALFALAGAGGAAGKSLVDFVRRETPRHTGEAQSAREAAEWLPQQDPGQDVQASYEQAVEHVERLEAVLRDILARPYVPGISGREYEALVRDLAKNALEDKP